VVDGLIGLVAAVSPAAYLRRSVTHHAQIPSVSPAVSLFAVILCRILYEIIVSTQAGSEASRWTSTQRQHRIFQSLSDMFVRRKDTAGVHTLERHNPNKYSLLQVDRGPTVAVTRMLRWV